jgi:hypothetical protein
LEDAALGLVLAIFSISVTAGLGVLALLEAPVAVAVIASLVVQRAPHRRLRGRVSGGGETQSNARSRG